MKSLQSEFGILSSIVFSYKRKLNQYQVNNISKIKFRLLYFLWKEKLLLGFIKVPSLIVNHYFLYLKSFNTNFFLNFYLTNKISRKYKSVFKLLKWEKNIVILYKTNFGLYNSKQLKQQKYGGVSLFVY